MKAALDVLREIGERLDRDEYPRILDGGVVRPFDIAFDPLLRGQEKIDEQSRQTRSSARPWEGASRWQRPPRPRQAGAAAQVIDPVLRTTYCNAVIELEWAYPRSHTIQTPHGMWLRIPSAILDGLEKAATFILFLPYIADRPPKAWGFWTTAVGFDWIGPRHTNFPDGSICAYEPGDETWRAGDELVALVDLYTLWALRHEHLLRFGKWPGRQSVRHPHERLIELKDNESCGCGNPRGTYAKCCKAQDDLLDKGKEARDFLEKFSLGVRRPPNSVFQFMRDGVSCPSATDIY